VVHRQNLKSSRCCTSRVMPIFLQGGEASRRSTDGLSGDAKRLSIVKTVDCQFVVETEVFVDGVGSRRVVRSPKAQQHGARGSGA